MARWDDLRRAITARDTDATERIWFEQIEANPTDPSPFLELADLQSRQTGGKRLAGSLLGVLADALKEKDNYAALLPVLAKLAAITPEEGNLRGDAVEAAKKLAEGRADVEHLLELSRVQGGSAEALDDHIRMLHRLLQIELDAWVFHKSGWGVGQVVEYDADRGKCVIDFRTRPGHEMDIGAAAKLLERLEPDDIRVQAMADPKGLRKRAKAEPLEMVRQVLARYNNRAPLRNVREALVPDAVATSTWSTWWKEAKKQALLDPRFDVGPGRDPRIEFHDIAQADFQAQVDRALKSEATAVGRQKAVADLFKVVGTNEEAKVALAEAVEKEIGLTRRASDRVGWVIVRGNITGENFSDELASALLEAEDPVSIVSAIEDDKTRVEAGRALVKAGEDGPEKLMQVIMRDDAAGARVAGETFSDLGRADLFDELLDKIEARPAQLPNLYAWYCRGLTRDRWHGREYEPAPLMLRILKVMDAVEFRQRKGSGDKDADARDKAAVTRLGELLTAQNCALAEAAAKDATTEEARHMLKMLAQNRALKGRALERLQDTILRDHPGALKAEVVEEEVSAQIYMTADGIQRWRADLDRINNEEMPENAKEIARAREFGDLKENAEYHAAREKQSLLQAKADELSSNLARAVAIQPDIIRTDAVSVGSRVKLKDSGGEELTYTLYGPPDTDMSKGIINYLTPLGQALMGTSRGDEVRLEIGGEVRELEVLDIENSMATTA